MSKKCNYCNKDFVCDKWGLKTRKYCSQECYHAGKSKIVKSLCLYCSKVFFATANKNRIFCSLSCSSKLKNKAKGAASYQWKGDNVGYNGIHAWIKRKLVKPTICQDCGQIKPLDLSNKSGKYKRDLTDWEWLCRKCHFAKDKQYLKRVRTKGGTFA